MTHVIQAREGVIQDLYPQVEKHFDDLRSLARKSVEVGAELGMHLEEAGKRHKDNFWTWLTSFTPTARKEVIHFALKAARVKSKHPELEDHQLVFALESQRETISSPKLSFVPPSADFSTRLTKLVVSLKDWTKDQPVETWTAEMKDDFRAQLEPLKDLYDRLTVA